MNKNFTLLVITLLSLFSFSFQNSSIAQSGKIPVIIDSAKAKDYYLEMRGTIKRFVGAAEINEEKLPTLEGATISVFDGMNMFMKVETNEKGKCTFRLPLEHTFKIQVSKKGYVTKFFFVNTIVPKLNLGAFSFNFDLDIFEEINKLDVSILKKAIAKVTYDPIYNRFQYDDSYTTRINFDIKKMYKNYYEIEKARKDSIAKFNKGDVEPPKEEAKKPAPKPGQKTANQKPGAAPAKETSQKK